MKNFKIKDKKSGEIFSDHGELDFHQITSEIWARQLIHSDLCCFALTQCNMLILLDECGNYANVPEGRFEIIWE